MRHELDIILIDEEVRFRAVSRFVEAVTEIRNRGFEEIRLDFSNCPAAFPEGMVPLLAQVSKLREDKINVYLKLPTRPSLHRLFLNTNWAHYLAPESYDWAEDAAYYNNYSAHRFSTSREQTDAVNGLLNVVMNKLLLPRDVLRGLEWSFNEITDNVLNHATSGSGFAQANWYPESGMVRFTVADAGIGILASLREGFPDLRNDTEALGEAIKAGITRNSEFGQGNGLAGTLRIATLTGGAFLIASGRGSLLVNSEGSKPIWVNPNASIAGTVVSATLFPRADFSISQAFDFAPRRGEITDIIDMRYTADDDALLVKLSDETVGFGSRSAGRQLRTKFLNLLNAVPDQPLIIDWSGIPVISSSFADEAVGKLFVELGPTAFSLRVKNARMEPLVRNLIDRAIIQRVTQNGHSA